MEKKNLNPNPWVNWIDVAVRQKEGPLDTSIITSQELWSQISRFSSIVVFLKAPLPSNFHLVPVWKVSVESSVDEVEDLSNDIGRTQKFLFVPHWTSNSKRNEFDALSWVWCERLCLLNLSDRVSNSTYWIHSHNEKGKTHSVHLVSCSF
jgi:hypothetical protein